ncbi:MAG TPA: 50S ribosomal protein L6 [Nitrospiria bacterium]|jgi:large subunit ribosomal protein L6
MSKVGRKPIDIPKGVEFKISPEKVVVKGPKGELFFKVDPRIKVELKEQRALVLQKGNDREGRAFHGLVRSQLANMVLGVTEGYEKILEINGVGYKAQVQGGKLVLNLGFSHPVEFDIPKGVEAKVEKQTTIKLKGIDKQEVGQIAANIRGLRPPEPYKGKGIRYSGEQVRTKEGKKAGK